MYTAGSVTVTGYFKSVRQFGAQVRRVLLDNAARHWGVPVAELTTEPNVIVHAKSGRRIGYGEVASFAVMPEKAPEITPEDLKKPSQFRLIGKDVMRVELPTKVNGTAQYSSTCKSPACSTAPCCAPRSREAARKRSTMQKREQSRRSQDRQISVRRRRDRGNTVGGVRRQGGAQRDVDARRQGSGLRH